MTRRLLCWTSSAGLASLMAAGPAYAALAVGWSRPRWTALPWRPAPRPLQAVLAVPVVWTGRVLVLAATAFVLAAAAFGSTTLNNNIAPLTIFVFGGSAWCR